MTELSQEQPDGWRINLRGNHPSQGLVQQPSAAGVDHPSDLGLHGKASFTGGFQKATATGGK